MSTPPRHDDNLLTLHGLDDLHWTAEPARPEPSPERRSTNHGDIGNSGDIGVTGNTGNTGNSGEDPGATSSHRHRGRLLPALVVLAAAFAVATAAFWVTGGRWFSVATPSMGTTAPVGTLVATRPVDVADLHIGDIVAFVPPTEPDVTYTHRIVAIADPGTTAATVTTRGDINGATDPWALTQTDIVGRTVLVAPGVGYLLRAMPLWLLGALVVWTLTRFWVRPAWRWPVRIVAAAVLYLVAALTIRPFLGVVQLVTTTDTDGSAHISSVSTGLLPIRLAPTAGHGTAAPVDLTYGQTGMVDLHPTAGQTGGSYQVAAHLHLPWWGWIAIIAFWCLPTLLALLAGRRRLRRTDGTGDTGGTDDTDGADLARDEQQERLARLDELNA